jgi:hypothetical protein
MRNKALINQEYIQSQHLYYITLETTHRMPPYTRTPATMETLKEDFLKALKLETGKEVGKGWNKNKNKSEARRFQLEILEMLRAAGGTLSLTQADIFADLHMHLAHAIFDDTNTARLHVDKVRQVYHYREDIARTHFAENNPLNDERDTARLHFGEATRLYTENSEILNLTTTTSTIPMTETKLGVLLSSPLNPNHDLQNALDHFIEAADKGCYHAKYWYGRALLNGFGVKRNTSEGFKLIQLAACHNVLRALYETANLHEEGCDGEGGPCIRKNHALATEYYKAITLRPPNGQEWVWDYAASHLAENRDWQATEDALGIHIGTMFSWEFAGQAFLFAAVAALAGFAQLDHYPALIILVPCIGIVIASISILISLNVVLRNWRPRDVLLQLYKAKLAACIFLVGPYAAGNKWEQPTRLVPIARVGEVFAVLLALIFFVGWILLLITELLENERSSEEQLHCL